MAVTVDHEPLPAERMGMMTVGQVLAHLQKSNRLVVHVLIDGQEPDLCKLGTVRQSPLDGHTVFIETADPREMAMGVLDAVEEQLAEAIRLKNEAADLLRQNQNVKAMEKLSGCFTTWQAAQQSLVQTAQLMRIDLNRVVTDNRPLPDLLTEFADQLKQIKCALESRDFVTLSDILVYETTETTIRWSGAIRAMKEMIG